jgi:hypothetical protein
MELVAAVTILINANVYKTVESDIKASRFLSKDCVRISVHYGRNQRKAIAIRMSESKPVIVATTKAEISH